MSTHYSTEVSLTFSSSPLSPVRGRRRQMPIATRPTVVGRQIGCDGSPNAATFERFLRWLDPDPETAGRKYESIRDRLISMFRARRCVFAEDLADATFERVMRKLSELTTEFTGDPARYFYGVAKKIYLEYQREVIAAHRRSKSWLPAETDKSDLEDRLQKLDEALSTLPQSDRELILSYYSGGGRRKIKHRRALAEQLGLRPNGLRLRVFRIRREIKDYIFTSSTHALSVAK